MESHESKRQSPPRRFTLQEPPALVREIYRAYTDELAAISGYTYASILLEKDLPAVATLFSTISITEMRHYEALGRLLRDLGVSHAMRTTVRDTPYRLLSDADSHAPVVAEQIIKDRLRDEKSARLTYLGLAKSAATERTRSTLLSLAEDEGEHAAALESALRRLMRS